LSYKSRGVFEKTRMKGMIGLILRLFNLEKGPNHLKILSAKYRGGEN